jgi:hypothetical protein
MSARKLPFRADDDTSRLADFENDLAGMFAGNPSAIIPVWNRAENPPDPLVLWDLIQQGTEVRR